MLSDIFFSDGFLLNIHIIYTCGWWVKRSEIEYKSHFGYIKISKLRSLLRILYTKNTRDNTTVEMFNILILYVLGRPCSIASLALPPTTILYRYMLIVKGTMRRTANEFMLIGVIMFTYGNNKHSRHSREIFWLLNHRLFINL